MSEGAQNQAVSSQQMDASAPPFVQHDPAASQSYGSTLTQNQRRTETATPGSRLVEAPGNYLNNHAQHRDNQQAQAPSEAPTGPAALRSMPSLPSPVSDPQVYTITIPDESMAFAHSRRWVSQEAQALGDYHKTMQKLRYLGCDKSPFIPRSPAELIQLRLSQLCLKSQRIATDIRQREKVAEHRKQGGSSGRPIPQLFGGKKFYDGLTAVFSQKHCFAQDDETVGMEGGRNQNDNVTWPSLLEFKASGIHGRNLPLPSLHHLTERNQNNTSHNDFEEKFFHMTPVTDRHILSRGSSPQADIGDVPAVVEDLIEEMSNDFDREYLEYRRHFDSEEIEEDDSDAQEPKPPGMVEHQL